MQHDGRHSRARQADGAALLVALLAMMLMTALATALVLATMTEAAIAGSYRDGLVTLYAAEGGADLAIDRVRTEPDWQALAAGARQWTFPQPAGAVSVRATAAALTPVQETLELTVQAVGPGGTQRTLAVVVARDNPPVSGRIWLVSWRENP